MRVLRIVGTGAALAILGVILLANWTLGLFILGGMLLGLCIRNRKFLVGLLILGSIAALSFYYFATRPHNEYSCLAPSFGIQENTEARYDDTRGGWLISRQFTVPAASVDAMADGGGNDCITADLGIPSSASTSERIARIEALLAEKGWRLLRVQSDGPVFDRPTEYLPATIHKFPQLKTRLSIPVPNISIGNAYFEPGENSTVSLTAPKGMILATTPPNEPKRATDGEISIVELSYDTTGVDVEALSPLVRFEPIRSLLDLTKSDLADYLFGLIGLLLAAVFKDKIVARPARLLGLGESRVAPAQHQTEGADGPAPT